MQTHHYKSWAEAAGLPETSARLGKLPDALRFPPNFPEPIRYDDRRKSLVYRGFMAAASYRFLHGLSTDSDYATALDALYEASADALEGLDRHHRLWVWLFCATSLAAAGLGIWRVWH
jgi:hypothetical protein